MDFKISTIGKLFFAGSAAWILWKTNKLRVKTPEDARKIAAAMNESAYCHWMLAACDGDVERMLDETGLRYARGDEFTRITGVKWPLD